MAVATLREFNTKRKANAIAELRAAIRLCESAARWIPPERSGHPLMIAYERVKAAERAIDDALQMIGD